MQPPIIASASVSQTRLKRKYFFVVIPSLLKETKKIEAKGGTNDKMEMKFALSFQF
jgi:hypothetical protein